MDSRVPDLISQIGSISSNYGVSVTATRPAKGTQFDIYMDPIDGTPKPFTANIIIDSDKMDLLPTLAGGKPKEILKMITAAGTFQAGDELAYNGHTFKVGTVQPVPFAGTDVADYVDAYREVS